MCNKWDGVLRSGTVVLLVCGNWTRHTWCGRVMDRNREKDKRQKWRQRQKQPVRLWVELDLSRAVRWGTDESDQWWGEAKTKATAKEAQAQETGRARSVAHESQPEMAIKCVQQLTCRVFVLSCYLNTLYVSIKKNIINRSNSVSTYCLLQWQCSSFY